MDLKDQTRTWQQISLYASLLPPMTNEEYQDLIGLSVAHVHQGVVTIDGVTKNLILNTL